MVIGGYEYDTAEIPTKIKKSLSNDGIYTLIGDDGEKRNIQAGVANTVLANHGWPSGRKENILLWLNAEQAN